MTALTWNQVHAWRLSRHCLTPRLKHQDYLTAVKRTGGLQAQVMSAAELALGARVDDLSPEDVRSALWNDRTLVKTWAMRGTLHLLATSDFPLYVAARSLYEPFNWAHYYAYYGITPEQHEALVAAVPHVLGGEPMTREQLITALADHVGAPTLRDLSGWGGPLKPLAFRGELCFGPNQGRNVTFVRPSKWIGTWQTIEAFPALQEIARRYLRAYGPTTLHDFTRWWGRAPTKKLFQSLSDELEPVDVEGWRAVALRTTLEPIQNSETSGSVNLLPLFDAYVLGLGRGLEPVLPQAHQSKVFSPQGWISAVVLVDGSMTGVWEHKHKGSQTSIKVRMFSPPAASTKQGIEAEAERLGAFFKTNVVLEYE